jgi:hypothetical protein
VTRSKPWLPRCIIDGGGDRNVPPYEGTPCDSLCLAGMSMRLPFQPLPGRLPRRSWGTSRISYPQATTSSEWLRVNRNPFGGAFLYGMRERARAIYCSAVAR